MTERIASASTLIREVLDDARSLIRDEVLLARTEIREQTAAAKSMGLVFGVAMVLALSGLVLFCVAIASALADLFDVAPWVSYGAIAVLLAIGAYVLSARARTRLEGMHVMPKTKASLKENIAWLQSKSGSR